MTVGKFITFEGGEGTGKSTQARLAYNALSEGGQACLLTREPGGTAGAEAIRELLLHPPTNGWNIRAEALLFAAARSDHVEKCIRPALAEGEWVICDRYLDSSRAYQGHAGKLGDQCITNLHQAGSEGLRPDLTILIEVPPELVAKRLSERDGEESDAIGGRDANYHNDVARGFRNVADAESERFFVIDGVGTVDDIHRHVMSAVSNSFGVLK